MAGDLWEIFVMTVDCTIHDLDVYGVAAFVSINASIHIKVAFLKGPGSQFVESFPPSSTMLARDRLAGNRAI